MSKSNEVANWYGSVFKSWQVKQLGPKPTADMLASIHGLGARPGKQALASAMALRDCGVTAGQIVIACGAPQLNKMRGFITDALLKRLPVSPSAEGHTVYRLELTPKGNKRIEGAKAKAAAADEAGKAAAETVVRKAKRAPGDAVASGVKAADKAKAKRQALLAAKPVKVETVASEAVTAIEPGTVDQASI